MKVLEETVKMMQPAANQPLGWTDPEVWSATQDFLLDAKLIPQEADVNTMFTNDFIQK